MQEAPAPSDASSTSQREPGQNLRGFDRDHRKYVEPRRRTTTTGTTRFTQSRSRGKSSRPLRSFCPRKVAQHWTPSRTPSSGDLDEDKAEDLGDLEEAKHAPGGPPVEAPMTRVGKGCNEVHTDHTAAEENAHRGASACGAGWCPAIAGLRCCQLEPCRIPETRNSQALSQRACATIPALAGSLRFCTASLFIQLSWADAPARTP